MRRPQLRQALKVLAAASGVAAICWYFGVDAWHAILLGCAITVTVLASIRGTSSPENRNLGWRRRDVRRAGSRNEVLNLSWSLRSGWGLVGGTADRRLVAIARRRLALEGLDLKDPEHRAPIEGRIGPRAYKVLTRKDRGRTSFRALIYCLDALDAADSANYPAPPARSGPWAWRLMRTRGRETDA